MNDIDYSEFITKAPVHRLSGRDMLFETLTTLAKARRDREEKEMEDARMRAANQLTYQSSMYGHDVTRQNAENALAQTKVRDADTAAYHQGTLANSAATLEQKKKEALAKLMTDPKFVEARQSGDPNAFGPWADAMQLSGLEVKDVMEPVPQQQPATPVSTEPPARGPDGEEIGEPLGPDDVYGPEMRKTGARSVAGQGINFTVDPGMNAQMALAKAKQARQGLESAAGETKDPMTADATRDVAVRVQALMAAGYSLKDALDKANSAIDSEAGRANARRNADVAGTRSQVVKPSQAADDLRANVGAFRANVGAWESHANADHLTDAFEKFAQLSADTKNYKEKGDVVGLRAALYGAARYITGPGVLTEQEYNNTVASTAGITAALLTKLQKGLSGDISDAEYQALARFVTNAQTTLKRRAIATVRGFDRRFSEKSYDRKMVPDEVASYRGELLNRFGLTDADVTPADANVAKGAAILKALQGGK